MRILQLGKFYPVRGGVEKVMWDLTRGLSKDGVDCNMLCAATPGEDVPAAIRFNVRGWCYTVPAVAKVAATMISPRMISWLRRHRNDYDIIHIHHPDPMACLALRMSGFKGKVVLHWHSDILKQRFFLKFYAPLQRWLIKRADRIVGTTPVYVRESSFLQRVQDKIECIPIGIEPISYDAAVAEEIRSRYPGKKIVFSLGRLVEYKGFTYLIDAARNLGPDYIVLIGGSGPLKDELQAQIDDAGMGEKVKLLGFLQDEYVHALYGACDVYVMSSVMKTEAFGIVQIEAMSCGKPVVATKIPGSGVSWVNEDGVSGINVPARDPEALAEAVVKITEDSALYRRFCEDSFARYEKMFKFAGMVKKTKTLYYNII